MKILLRIAVIAAVAALAAGCCKCRSYQKKNRRPLIGTEWQLIQLDGRAVKPEEGKFYVMFLAEENRFAGVGACNRLMGKYETTDKGALRIGPIASTMMACPGMEREHAFAQALEAAVKVVGDQPGGTADKLRKPHRAVQLKRAEQVVASGVGPDFKFAAGDVQLTQRHIEFFRRADPPVENTR